MIKSVLSVIKSNPISKLQYGKMIAKKINASFDKVVYGKVKDEGK